VEIAKILNELRLERQQLELAILSLERLAAGGSKRRGRPPAWMASAKSPETAPRPPGRPAGSKDKGAGA
jgi:hypothetical protein